MRENAKLFRALLLEPLELRAVFSAVGLDGPSSRTIRVQVTDSGGLTAIAQATVSVQNVAPNVGAITASIDPLPVGSNVAVNASFTDAGIPDTHPAQWIWDDGATSSGTVTEVNGSGSASGTHTFTVAGVYEIRLTVTDDDGGANGSVFQYVVIYDPQGGFVTGGGWIDSPAGAYLPDATLFDLGGLHAELEDLLGVSVDLLTPGDLPPRMRERVLTEAVPV